MRDLINWKDHVVEYPNRFRERSLGDGLVEETREPGEIFQQGTAMNAQNFNIMDLAALEAMLMANENTRDLIHIKDTLRGAVGEKITVTLTNTQPYPHNNSKNSGSVQLSTSRNTKDYTVDCDIVSVEGGAVGDFEFSDKLLNGFKIAYTGSATKVVVDCYVRGGI